LQLRLVPSLTRIRLVKYRRTQFRRVMLLGVQIFRRFRKTQFPDGLDMKGVQIPLRVDRSVRRSCAKHDLQIAASMMSIRPVNLKSGAEIGHELPLRKKYTLSLMRLRTKGTRSAFPLALHQLKYYCRNPPSASGECDLNGLPWFGGRVKSE